MQYQSGAVSPTESISEGWNIIKSDYWMFFLMSLVMIVIVIAAAFILGLVSNAITFGIGTVLGISTAGSSDAVRVGASIVPQLLSMFISLFTNILVGAISGALFCGIYQALARKANTGVADFGDLFSGFQKFTACLVVAGVISIIQFIISVILLVIGAAVGVSFVGLAGLSSIVGPDGQPNMGMLGGLLGMMAVFGLIYIVINLIISALTSFAYPLIGDRNLSGGQALGLSAKAGLANIGGLILLLILLGLMMFAGALACLVGILFVAPIMSAALFAAYRRVFGAGQNNYQYAPPPPPNFGNQPGY